MHLLPVFTAFRFRRSPVSTSPSSTEVTGSGGLASRVTWERLMHG